MKTFIEWVQENHPDTLDENWRKWAAGGLIGLTAAAGLSNKLMQQKPQQKPAITKTATSPNVEKFTNPEQGIWHPYRFQNGEEVPDWEKAAENERRTGDTHLRDEHKGWYKKLFKNVP